ncbi:MAG: hypothetical protein V1807_02350 [Patescibacteria group bacterium]
MKNSGLAAVLSFFVVGLGQIYNGQIGKGIFFLVGYYLVFVIFWSLFFSSIFTGDDSTMMASVTSVFIAPIIVVALWIFNIVDAHKNAERINKQASKTR